MQIRSETYPFIIVLKHKNDLAIRTIGILFSVISLLIFSYRSYSSTGSTFNLVPAAAIFIFIVWNIVQIIQKKKVTFFPVFLISFLGALFLPPFNLLIITVSILLSWMERESLASQEIGFAKTHIIFNGLWNRKHDWTEISNVVLKDGILTIDFKNNRLFQKETDDLEDDEYDGEEDEFNAFCQEQLLLSKNSN